MLQTRPVTDFNIKLADHTVEVVKSEILLGVFIDQLLNWKNHVNKIHKAGNLLFAKFRPIKPFLPTNYEIKYCKSFIFSTLTIVAVSGAVSNPSN